ncbi:hypothetical protein [Candidatus Hecatella orcuttiae]|uniref:hypothetical protein n=1 Tax=Candidatus Hecatella orcuttiae TaxID=1935119 RepID=UPI002868050C|nr:hypothetical protein [Candidatus Hecatella orcuttiae]
MSDSPAEIPPASETAKPSPLRMMAEALKLHRQGKPLAKDDVISLFFSMADYVHKAWKAGLSKRSECAYAGSLLLYETLKRTGFRFASDVEDANRIWKAGMKLAEEIWNKLESSRNNPLSGEGLSFKEEIQAMSSLLWEEYQKVANPPAGQVEGKGLTEVFRKAVEYVEAGKKEGLQEHQIQMQLPEFRHGRFRVNRVYSFDPLILGMHLNDEARLRFNPKVKKTVEDFAARRGLRFQPSSFDIYLLKGEKKVAWLREDFFGASTPELFEEIGRIIYGSALRDDE